MHKFQRYISIFDLVTEKKRPSRYFGDLAWTGRSMSLPARCKSEIIVVITSATKQMTHPNCSVTSQYLTYLQSRKGPSCRTTCNMGFPPRCKSQIIFVITSATKLMSHPNSSITSQYLTWLQTKKGHPGT